MAELATALVSECWSVAAAEGASLDPADAEAFVAEMAKLAPVGTSMLYDRRAGRPVEHDAIYGSVARAGRRRNVPTPTVDLIAALLEAGDPISCEARITASPGIDQMSATPGFCSVAWRSAWRTHSGTSRRSRSGLRFAKKKTSPHYVHGGARKQALHNGVATSPPISGLRAAPDRTLP